MLVGIDSDQHLVAGFDIDSVVGFDIGIGFDVGSGIGLGVGIDFDIDSDIGFDIYFDIGTDIGMAQIPVWPKYRYGPNAVWVLV